MCIMNILQSLDTDIIYGMCQRILCLKNTSLLETRSCILIDDRDRLLMLKGLND